MMCSVAKWSEVQNTTFIILCTRSNICIKINNSEVKWSEVQNPTFMISYTRFNICIKIHNYKVKWSELQQTNKRTTAQASTVQCSAVHFSVKLVCPEIWPEPLDSLRGESALPTAVPSTALHCESTLLTELYCKTTILHCTALHRTSLHCTMKVEYCFFVCSAVQCSADIMD